MTVMSSEGELHRAKGSRKEQTFYDHTEKRNNFNTTTTTCNLTGSEPRDVNTGKCCYDVN